METSRQAVESFPFHQTQVYGEKRDRPANLTGCSAEVRTNGTDSPASSTSETGQSDGHGSSVSRPYFFPPLWLARRTACVDALRKEGVRSVADLGCGSGSLLQMLVLPASHLDDFPSLYPTPLVPSSLPAHSSVQSTQDSLSLDTSLTSAAQHHSTMSTITSTAGSTAAEKLSSLSSSTQLPLSSSSSKAAVLVAPASESAFDPVVPGLYAKPLSNTSASHPQTAVQIGDRVVRSGHSGVQSFQSNLDQLRNFKLDQLRTVQRPDTAQQELHLRRVVGVDIKCQGGLSIAEKVSAPPISRSRGLLCGRNIALIDANDRHSQTNKVNESRNSEMGQKNVNLLPERSNPQAKSPDEDATELPTGDAPYEPLNAVSGGLGYERERWEPLTVELWEGGLEIYNEALDGIEAMVATEVIEHLNPQALAKFGPVVLGIYQPRLLVVTTPNHEFNSYFVPPSNKKKLSADRFPDPTGRTNRVFRDDDHKFEWTMAEFQAWAKQQARENDYQVTFTGVGSLRHYYGQHQSIPFPPPSLDAHPALVSCPTSTALPKDPHLFYATQIAVFKRHYSNEAERSPRSHRPSPLPFYTPTSPLVSGASSAGPGGVGDNNTGLSSELSTTQLVGSSPRSAILPAKNGSTVGNGSGISASSHSSRPRPSLAGRQSSISYIPHILYKTHTYPVEHCAGNSSSPTLILAALERLFCDFFRRGKVSLQDLWSQSELREISGGVIGSVVDAVVDEDREGAWRFFVDPQKKGTAALEIVWDAYTAEPLQDDMVYEQGVYGSETEWCDEGSQQRQRYSHCGEFDEDVRAGEMGTFDDCEGKDRMTEDTISNGPGAAAWPRYPSAHTTETSAISSGDVWTASTRISPSLSPSGQTSDSNVACGNEGW